MIQVTNISGNLFVISTVIPGGRGVPTKVEIPPKWDAPNWVRFMKASLRAWPVSAKLQLADGVSFGLVQVNELNAVHISPDKRTVPEPTASFSDVAASMATALAFKTFFNDHVISPAWHTVTGITLITVATTPVTWAQVYLVVADAQAQYSAHRVDAAVHPFIDTVNVLSLGIPATPVAAVAALQELYRCMGSHMQWVYASGNPALSPEEIIEYGGSGGGVVPGPITGGIATLTAYASPEDFTVVRTSATQLTLSNLDFYPTSDMFEGIVERNASGKIIVTYSPVDYTFVYAAGVLTVAGANFGAASLFEVRVRGPQRQFSDVMEDLAGENVLQSPGDFAVAWTNITTLAITGMSFAPTRTQIRAVAELRTDGRLVFVYTPRDYAFTYTPGALGSGTLVVTGATFVTTSTFVVFIVAPAMKALVSTAGVATTLFAKLNKVVDETGATLTSFASMARAGYVRLTNGTVEAEITQADAAHLSTAKVLLVQSLDATGNIVTGGTDTDTSGMYSSPEDFTVTYTALTQLTLTDLPFFPLSEQFEGVIEKNATGQILARYSPFDHTFTYAAGVLTVSAATFGAASKFEVRIRGPEKKFSEVMEDLAGENILQSPGDFAVAWTNITTLAITGMSFAPTRTQIRAVAELRTDGKLINVYTPRDYAFTYTPGALGAGTLVVTGAGFVTTSTFVVFIVAPSMKTLVSTAGVATTLFAKLVKVVDETGATLTSFSSMARAGFVRLTNGTVEAEITQADAAHLSTAKVLLVQALDATGNVAASSSGATDSSGMYSSPEDFTVTYTALTQVTLTDLPFTPLSEQFEGVTERNATGKILASYSPGDHDFTYAAGVLTVSAATFGAASKFEVRIRGPEKKYLAVMQDLAADNIRQSPGDFTVVWTNITTLALTGMSFAPAQSQIRAVAELRTDGKLICVYTPRDYAFTYTPGALGAGTLIVTGATFVTTSTFVVFIAAPAIKYLGVSAIIKPVEIVGTGATAVALAANPLRTHAIITNIETSTTPIWLGLGAVAEANKGIRLGPGMSFVIDDGWRFLGAINFFGAITTTVAVWEA